MTPGWASEQARAVFERAEAVLGGDGIAVGVTAIDADGPAFAGTSWLPPDARFEIGSVTKTMTATLLATLALDGTVSLDDPIGRWTDAGPNGDITLEQLATHTAGLPHLAPNQPVDWANPFRDLTAERAEEALRTAIRPPGADHLYTNFGYQLLGIVLERASGHTYQDLLAERLFGPLQMTCSGVGEAGGGTRLTGNPVGHWERALPAAGGIESTMEDVARYLAACLHPRDDLLGRAMTLCRQPRARAHEGREVGLAWFIMGDVVRHNGRTGGFGASVAVNRVTGRAMGALANVTPRPGALLADWVLPAVSGRD
jgi:D-alanyl-D-alanine-carboxypeptidase/D-alanyl-D-alanine-endopeptidase